MKPLGEQYRPASWSDVVGQDKVVDTIRRLAQRGLGGRAFWISGQSGTGKTTIGRLIADEVADEFNTEELDATDLTPARLRDSERGMWMKALGAKSGRAYLVNEAHGLRKDSIRQLLVLLERIPHHALWVFTTTVEGQQSLFEDYDDASPLLSRCIDAGNISALVVWRLDRLGRTASGLTTLFEKLSARKVNLVSLKDGVDLSTAAGRLIANVLASVAAYENEVRAERIIAGQQAARAAGKRWGGSKRGRRLKVTAEQARMIRRMHAEGTPKAAIARATGLSRPTVYDVLGAERADPQ